MRLSTKSKNWLRRFSSPEKKFLCLTHRDSSRRLMSTMSLMSQWQHSLWHHYPSMTLKSYKLWSKDRVQMRSLTYALKLFTNNSEQNLSVLYLKAFWLHVFQLFRQGCGIKHNLVCSHMHYILFDLYLINAIKVIDLDWNN